MIRIRVKTFVLIIIALIGIKLLVEYKYDKRPFKFERYDDNTFLKAAKEFMPIGGDIDQAIDILQNSGAKCRIVRMNENLGRNYYSKGSVLPDTIFMISCNYRSECISLYEFACYHLDIQINKDLKIVNISGYRIIYCGFWVI